MFTEEQEFKITYGHVSFDDWLSKPYVSSSLRQRLETSNVLIIPQEGYGDYSDPLFVAGTDDLFRYMSHNASNEVVVDVCIADEDYKTLSLHSDILRLGSFLVTSTILPLFVNLLSSYIYEKMRSTKVDTWMDLEITTVNGHDSSTTIKFKGPVDVFEREVSAKIDSILIEGKRDDNRNA